ncbi:cytochrome P450 [Sphingomonas crocodyli]|uniref:Cytochrome P450 n=1 Tax=Sphingomonas crocodyli TaxID=1979270 RepID=A0A437LXZ8_9SPHN|nr:cytochrome P450 [Sphingomonas crocodyli]RVT90271.1 cytochrome P450 [Sphingomonas crocodyli]
MKDIAGTELLEPGNIDNPYPFYRRLYDQPVWRVPDTDVAVISSFAMIDEAVRRVEDFSSNMNALLYKDARGLPARLPFGSAGVQVLATADPPLHGAHKKAIFPEFVGRRMTALEPEVVEIARARIRRAMDLGTADFMAEIGGMVPISIISKLIGFEDADLQVLLQAAYDSTSILGATLTMEELVANISKSNEVGAWIAGQLHAASPDREDILGSIARSVRDGVLQQHEAIIFLHTMLSAGGESTSSLLGNAARMLAEDQELQQRLREAPSLIPKFIEEALRLESPFRHHLRSVPHDTQLGGVDIPSGTTVLMMWGAANRDPAEHLDPNRIDLDRKRGQVAFGRGIHTCVGAPLAKLEARVVFEELLAATTNISLPNGAQPKWESSLMVRRHETLPMVFA